ncbi:MAG: S-layer homology domain-containing protein [Clostridia bacterium]|nr:S-layer homology domain-containing protein [Clostridia bacterium]
MKKSLLLIMAAILMLSALSVTALAVTDDDFVNENEFVVASFNGVNSFIGKGKVNDLEDAAYWLINEKDRYNIKYVSFVGSIANVCQHSYSSIVVNQGKSVDDLSAISLDDPDWNKQYQNFARVLDVFTQEALPVGVSGQSTDLVADGFNRESLQATYMAVETIMNESVTYDFLDDSNYCTYIENNGIVYMIFQLEIWPREATLNWVNETLKNNTDKYAIIYTTSFLDSSGSMYTMWDWAGGFKMEGNSGIAARNLAWTDKPRDGKGVWDYCFSNHDNILAIISSNIKVPEVYATKVTNDRGIDVALIAANADVAMNANGPTALLTKISADNKEISCVWSTAFKGIGNNAVHTVKLDKIATLTEPLAASNLPHIKPQYNGANNAYIFGYEGNTFRPNANMTRAEACTIFARLLLETQTIPDGYTTRFEDVKSGDWFYNAIAYLDETGFFSRNKNTEYKPNEPITRAEFVDLANAASSLSSKNDGVSFADVPEDHFYYTSIMAAASSGLVNGYEDNTFRPDNTITRAEVVTVINRLLGLKVSDKTVSTKHLENEFVDIGEHWGRLNVLMASNSDVHGDYYYEKTLDGVTESSTEITFENSHISISVNKKNGKVTKIINKYTGENIATNATKNRFLYLEGKNNSIVTPNGFDIEGNRIKVSFKGGVVVYMLVEICDNYMTFEIDSELGSGGEAIVFGNLATNIIISEDDESFRINAVGMSAWTNPVNKGYGNYSSTVAKAYSKYVSGTMGAKLGIAFGKKGVILDYLKEIMQAIDLSVGITGTTGGAYAQDFKPNSGDYVIVGVINEETVPKIIDTAVRFGVDQIDIHKGTGTHRPGDFHFYNTETGTAKEYYEKYGKQFEEAGLLTGLHTYAYYIDYNATSILSDPKWQNQLETLETYTLRGKLTKFKVSIKTEEDATAFDRNNTFFHRNSPYVRIDNEIIRVGQGTTEGFIKCIRGQCGTVAADHAAGTTVYHLGGYFNLFTPVLGSDLFYHVADLTAKAYNDGGFGMIYLDAIDGLGQHLPENHEVWYYFQMFVHRIVSQCKVSPIIETSSGAPQEWNVRGRAGAYDSPSRGYNMFNEGHIANNRSNMTTNMNTTLGWYQFYPDRASVYKNTLTRTHFFNNFDYMGYQSIIYNMSTVINSFDPDTINASPFFQQNLNYYNKYYSSLRKSEYFSDEVIEKVKASEHEFKVIEKTEGVYAFLEMYYNYGKIGNAVGAEMTFKGNNPFKAQSPFIRIEQMFSTLGENATSLVKFDEEKKFSEQQLVASFTAVNVAEKPTLKMRVQGTGNDGDAMLLSLSGNDGGRADYFVDLSFEGWRDVIVAELDNGAYDTDKYNFTGITLSGGNYASFVSTISFSGINRLQIRTCGSTVGEARIGEIFACTPVDATVKNPTVKIGGESITFNTTLKAGEYLEYDPLTDKAIVYHAYEQTTEEVTYTGGIKNAPSGTFTGSYSAEALTDAPTRAIVVTGFAGQEITN